MIKKKKTAPEKDTKSELKKDSKEAGTGKRVSKFKKPTKKQQIIFSIVGGVVAVLAIVAAVVYSQSAKQPASASRYQAMTIVQADALLFNGTVSAQNTEEFYFDQTQGKISEILVTNGQEITANTAVLAYQNETIQEQVDEQQQTLEKLNLGVTSAQQSLNSAYEQKQAIQNKINQGTNAYNAADANTPEGQLKRQEEQAKIDQCNEALSSQDGIILQAQQALDAANLDLASANQSIENAKNKVTMNVTSTIDGMTIVDQKGKNDPTVPVVKVISKGTVVEAKVSEYDYSRIAKDQAVTIRPINSDQAIAGTITEVNELPDSSAATAAVSNQSTMANYSFKVKPGEELHYGYSCQVVLPVNELRIPEKAIVNESGQQYVFVYANGKVRKNKIIAENKEGIFIVNEGLKEKDQIIANPDKDLKDGQEVTVN